MSQALQHHITEKENGWTVGQVLAHSMGLTKREISRAKFCSNGICLDGIRCRTADRVHTGEVLKFQYSDVKKENHPASVSAPVLYEDDDVMVLDKPSGIVCHPSHGHYSDSLMLQGSPYVRCVGRLDKDTSGVLLIAKNRLAAARLSRQRESGVLRKEYLAIVHGVFPEEKQEGWICLPLKQETVTAPDASLVTRMSICQDGEGMQAKTHYQVLCRDKEYSLVGFWLETGRMHQIRVHMSAIGHPLFGDPLYGTGDDGGSRAALHAFRIQFLQPMTGEKIEINSFRTHMFD